MIKSKTILSTAGNCYEVSSEFEALLLNPRAKLRRWAAQLAVCFSVMGYREFNLDLICLDTAKIGSLKNDA